MTVAVPSGADDAALAVAASSGDRAAFAAIYDRYANRLHDFSVGMLRDRDAAADCVQDTFVTAASKLGQLREPERLRPWLYAIARSECMARLRHSHREHLSDDLPDMPTDEADLATLVARTELAELIASASGGLSDRDRAVLELAYRQNLDGADLADALGVTARNANTLVERMRDTIARSLGALLVCRRVHADPQRCAELAELLGDWDGTMTVLLRKRAARHIESCGVCNEERGRLVTPAALLGSTPLVVPAPTWLRDRTLDRVELPGHSRGESWWPESDFDNTDMPTEPRWARARTVLAASLGLIGLAAALLLMAPREVPVQPARTTETLPVPTAASVASVSPPAPSQPASSQAPPPTAIPRSAAPLPSTVVTQAPQTTEAPETKDAPRTTEESEPIATPPSVSKSPVTTRRPQPQQDSEEPPEQSEDETADPPPPGKPPVPTVENPPPVDKSPDEQCTILNPCDSGGPPVFN